MNDLTKAEKDELIRKTQMVLADEKRPIYVMAARSLTKYDYKTAEAVLKKACERYRDFSITYNQAEQFMELYLFKSISADQDLKIKIVKSAGD
jgi:hypothetical protein